MILKNAKRQGKKTADYLLCLYLFAELPGNILRKGVESGAKFSGGVRDEVGANDDILCAIAQARGVTDGGTAVSDNPGFFTYNGDIYMWLYGV